MRYRMAMEIKARVGHLGIDFQAQLCVFGFSTIAACVFGL